MRWPAAKRQPVAKRQPAKRQPGGGQPPALNKPHTLLQLWNTMQCELECAQHTTSVPHTFQEVLRSAERDQWLATMCCEYDALVMNDTFDLIKLPAGRQAISTWWVLKLKSPGIYKACFVACRFSQKPGVDYDDTYAPVVLLENLQLLLAHVVMHGLVVHSMDIYNAFLQAELHEEVYITQPEGFISRN